MKKRSYNAAIAFSAVLLVVAFFVVWDRHAAAPTAKTSRDIDIFAGIEPIFTNRVTIGDYAFSPQTIQVKKGKSVIWTNTDAGHHSVVSQRASLGLQSEPLKTGGTYSFAFDEPGEYVYRCGEHADMLGKVIVTN